MAEISKGKQGGRPCNTKTKIPDWWLSWTKNYKETIHCSIYDGKPSRQEQTQTMIHPPSCFADGTI